MRRYRSKHGLSREALAEKLDISDSYLAALELGTRKPSYDTLLKIVNTLEVSADSVIGTDGYVGKLEEKSEISIALDKLDPPVRKYVLAALKLILDHFSK